MMPPQGAAPSGGLNAAAELMKEYNRMAGDLPGARTKADTSLADMMAGLKDYAPDPSEKWLNFAANIAKPTKFGTLGEVATNVAGGLEPIVGKENALKNQYRQLALQMGYQANEKNADQLQSGKLALLKDMVAQQRAQQGKAVVKMDKDGNMVKFDPITETASVIHSSMLGPYADLVKKFAADAVAHGSFPDLDAATEWAKSKAFDVMGSAKAANPTTTVPSPGAIPQQSGPLSPGVPTPTPMPQVAPPASGTPMPVLGEDGSTRKDGRPSGFPVVTPPQQASRDADRAAIVGKELADATARMNAAPLNSPERAQAQQDVISLKREAAQPGTAIRTPKEIAQQKTEGEGAGKKVVEQGQATSALADFLDESANTKKVLNEAVTHPGMAKATGEQGMVPFRGNVMTAGGTDSAGFIAKIDALKSQLGFMKMQAMKAASASGSTGLGAVTEAEHKLLQQQIESIDLKQPTPQIEKALRDIDARIDQMRNRMVEAYGRQYPGTVRQIKGKTFVQGKDGLWNPL